MYVCTKKHWIGNSPPMDRRTGKPSCPTCRGTVDEVVGGKRKSWCEACRSMQFIWPRDGQPGEGGCMRCNPKRVAAPQQHSPEKVSVK